MGEEDFEKVYQGMAEQGLLDPILINSTTYKDLVLRGLKTGYQMTCGDEDRRGALQVVTRQLKHLFGFIPLSAMEKISALNYEQVMNLAFAIIDLKEDLDLKAWLAKNV